MCFFVFKIIETWESVFGFETIKTCMKNAVLFHFYKFEQSFLHNLGFYHSIFLISSKFSKILVHSYRILIFIFNLITSVLFS